ncbi:MAG: radical SAM protein [Desulfovibrionaceae bacterium]
MSRPVTRYYGRDLPPRLDWGGRLPVALLAPGAAGSALSSLGWQTVYRLLAEDPGFAPERFVTEGRGTPRSWDFGAELVSFPAVAPSIPCEEDILPLAQVLGAAAIPIRREERRGRPLVLAGGPLAFLNPAPFAPMVDLAWVGEAEAGFPELLARLREHLFAGGDPEDFLDLVADEPGVYAPGRTRGRARRVAIGTERGLPAPAYSLFTGPEAAFRDSLLVEVNRGCPYGCRFCAAGFVYRPPRQAAMADLQALVEAANPPKVGLIGTALTDWPDLTEFLEWLAARHVKFSLASVRADGLTEELVGLLRREGVRSVTLALEAPSRRLRRACAKRLDEAALVEAVARCSRLGVNHLKLYCIVGWPGETDADYEELDAFLAELAAARDAHPFRAKDPMRITLSASCLVPKPQTPMQWAPMAGEEQLKRRLAQLKDMARRHKALRVEGDSPSHARLQGLLARGGEELFELVELAAARGSWKAGLKAWGRDPAEWLDRERGEQEVFPWEVVDTGVTRAHLWREWREYLAGRPSPPCPAEGCGPCPGCGADALVRPPDPGA